MTYFFYNWMLSSLNLFHLFWLPLKLPPLQQPTVWSLQLWLCFCFVLFVPVLFSRFYVWTCELFPYLDYCKLQIMLQISSWVSVFVVFPEKYSEVESLDHVIIIFLIFWRTSVLFCISVTQTYIPTNRAWGFPFLRILSSTCCFLCFW